MSQVYSSGGTATRVEKECLPVFVSLQDILQVSVGVKNASPEKRMYLSGKLLECFDNIGCNSRSPELIDKFVIVNISGDSPRRYDEFILRFITRGPLFPGFSTTIVISRNQSELLLLHSSFQTIRANNREKLIGNSI